MLRVLAALLFVLVVPGCGGAKDDVQAEVKRPALLETELNPFATSLYTPPVNGKLPEYLIPPR